MRIRRMLEKGMSLDEIAEELNKKGVRAPHGSGRWSAATVRKAFVS
jgi:Recombinase